MMRHASEKGGRCALRWRLVVTVSGLSTLQTLTSPDSSFQFKYSPLLVVCKRDDPTTESETLGVDSLPPPCGFCESFDRSRSTTACFAYPESEFKDKPEFFVALLKEKVTEENLHWRRAEAVFEKFVPTSLFKSAPLPVAGDPGRSRKS